MSDAATALPEASERPLQMLERLAEAGLEIALVLERRVKEAEPAVPLAELTNAAQAFDRVSRAVRLCLLLREELAKDYQAQAEAGRQDEARTVHRDRALGVVRRVARDHCGHDPFAVSMIAKEAAERLDTDDIYGLVTNRPVGELVALICRDLGLDPDWDALAEEAWAQAERDSRAEGSPFARPPSLAGGGGCDGRRFGHRAERAKRRRGRSAATPRASRLTLPPDPPAPAKEDPGLAAGGEGSLGRKQEP